MISTRDKRASEIKPGDLVMIGDDRVSRVEYVTPACARGFLVAVCEHGTRALGHKTGLVTVYESEPHP